MFSGYWFSGGGCDQGGGERGVVSSFKAGPQSGDPVLRGPQGGGKKKVVGILSKAWIYDDRYDE